MQRRADLAYLDMQNVHDSVQYTDGWLGARNEAIDPFKRMRHVVIKSGPDVTQGHELIGSGQNILIPTCTLDAIRSDNHKEAVLNDDGGRSNKLVIVVASSERIRKMFWSHDLEYC